MTHVYQICSTHVIYVLNSAVCCVKKPVHDFICFYQCKGSNWDLFENQYLFQKSLSLTMKKSYTPTDSHCEKITRVIDPKMCASWIYMQWKLDLGHFLLKFYNGTQWVFVLFPLSDIYKVFWNKYWFVNRSQFDSLPWYKALLLMYKYCSFHTIIELQ